MLLHKNNRRCCSHEAHMGSECSRSLSQSEASTNTSQPIRGDAGVGGGRAADKQFQKKTALKLTTSATRREHEHKDTPATVKCKHVDVRNVTEMYQAYSNGARINHTELICSVLKNSGIIALLL